MGGKAVSSVISIVLLLAVVEATQFSISIPGNSVGKSYVACCPNAAADACFAYCLEHSTHYFDLVKVCPRRCNCPFVEGSECNAVWGMHPPSTTLVLVKKKHANITPRVPKLPWFPLA